jgi:uncharacterized membrane protein YhhN
MQTKRKSNFREISGRLEVRAVQTQTKRKPTDRVFANRRDLTGTAQETVADPDLYRMLRFQIFWLKFLWFVWAALLFGGLIFGDLDEATGQRIPTWARMASSLTLVIAASSWFSPAEPTWLRRMSFFLALGMLCGFVGDLCLAQLIMSDGKREGIGAFALGHVLYMIAFAGTDPTRRVGPLKLGVLGAWELIGVLGWVMIALPSSAPDSLRWGGLAYALLLSAMAGYATSLVFVSTRFIAVALGAVLFFTSDTILSAQLFRDVHFPMIGSVVWLTYGPAQMLIVYGCNWAARQREMQIAKVESIGPSQ